MSSDHPRRIAIIGAGPIGLEAALYGSRLGHEVRVYERGRVADNVHRWGHVRMFSPWRMNGSSLGVRELARLGMRAPAADEHPTGHELAEHYLEPLARSPALEGRILEGNRVLAIGRERISKSDRIAGGREAFPFRLLVESAAGERVEQAETVIDSSGTFRNPRWLGSGNVPAVGERELADRIAYHVEDYRGPARSRYSGKRVLLVGNGHSAATALDQLLELDGVSIDWAVRDDTATPLEEIPDDPLPGRRELCRKANRLAAGADTRITYRRAAVVERLESRPRGIAVELSRNGRREEVTVDRVIGLVGYMPDRSLYRELQVHECYATFGPMKLAATLLAQTSGDCLTQKPVGADVLRNPEPDFFILGAKSYGCNPRFLIRTGQGQIREVYGLIQKQPGLDLYAT